MLHTVLPFVLIWSLITGQYSCKLAAQGYIFIIHHGMTYNMKLICDILVWNNSNLDNYKSILPAKNNPKSREGTDKKNPTKNKNKQTKKKQEKTKTNPPPTHKILCFKAVALFLHTLVLMHIFDSVKVRFSYFFPLLLYFLKEYWGHRQWIFKGVTSSNTNRYWK